MLWSHNVKNTLHLESSTFNNPRWAMLTDHEIYFVQTQQKQHKNSPNGWVGKFISLLKFGWINESMNPYFYKLVITLPLAPSYRTAILTKITSCQQLLATTIKLRKERENYAFSRNSIWHRKTHNHTQSHSFRMTNWPNRCLWTVGESRSTQREPTWACKQKGPKSKPKTEPMAFLLWGQQC